MQQSQRQTEFSTERDDKPTRKYDYLYGMLKMLYSRILVLFLGNRGTWGLCFRIPRLNPFSYNASKLVPGTADIRRRRQSTPQVEDSRWTIDPSPIALGAAVAYKAAYTST